MDECDQISVTFQVSPTSGEPIFRQLIEQVKRFVASGQLATGDRLPSVRQLARTLSVNPMTVSKAYSHLEMDGVVERRPGVGMLVSGLCRPDESARLALLHPALDDLLLQSHQLGVSTEALAEGLEARAIRLREENRS